MKAIFAFTILLALSAANAAVPSWPQFRGPNSAGVAEAEQPPVEFGPTTNLLWKTEVPPGVSSPCVWGDRIFLTAAEDGKLLTLAVNRRDGQIYVMSRSMSGAKMPPFAFMALGVDKDGDGKISREEIPKQFIEQGMFSCVKGTVTMAEAGDTLQVKASNILGEPIFATPAIADDKLYIRTAEHLWAFGAK
jgi:hypothetical protein